MKTILVYSFLAIFLIAGCGNQTASVKQETSTPTGSIQGLVSDYNANTPLSGVTISTTANALASTKSNLQGIYQLGGLPTGAYYPLYFSLPGYGTSIYGTNLGNTPPSFPQGNAVSVVNAYMYPENGTVKGTVYLNGNPIQNAQVEIDMRNLTGAPLSTNPTGFIGINLVKQTTTDASGSYVLTNLPAAQDNSINANIMAWYVDSNGVYYADYNTVNVYNNATSYAPDLNLACNLPRPDVVATSQDISADNTSTNPLTIHVGVFYNEPMDSNINPGITFLPGCASATGFMWTGTTAGQFTVTVNANTNCSGATYWVRFARNVCGKQQNPYYNGVLK
ncbi:MAG: hypothetical protein ACP5OF_06195 [bacterium]